MYSDKSLVILDADGTTIDAFAAMTETFLRHEMDLGDLSRFQKRHNLFKYLGGVKEFPKNLRKQLNRVERKRLIATLTNVYRENARLYPAIQPMINTLLQENGIVVGVVTRNITAEPLQTLKQLYFREGVDVDRLDFLVHVPLREKKTGIFRKLRDQFNINPARCMVCGDENKDYMAALSAGMYPLMASYGFESHQRLTEKYEIPEEVIVSSPQQLAGRLLHALQLQPQGPEHDPGKS